METSVTPAAERLAQQFKRRGRALPWYAEVAVRIVREKPLGTFGGVLVILLILVAILAPFLTPYHPYAVNIDAQMVAPNGTHFFGTDNYGRDIYTRILYGARVSLYVGLGAVGIATTLASILGCITGYFGGKFDIIVQRIVDAVMAFPWLIIIISIMSVIGPGLTNVTLVLGLMMIAGNSRVVRGAVMAIKENQYVEAARTIGCGHRRILLLHIFPNVSAPITILTTIGLGAAILAEASLSFLGFGVTPPDPSWGLMLSGLGRQYMIRAPWIAIFPGVAICIAVFGFNMLGDALRDVLDPRLRGT